MEERDSLIAVNLSTLHWDNGCRKCPLIEECKKQIMIKIKNVKIFGMTG